MKYAPRMPGWDAGVLYAGSDYVEEDVLVVPAWWRRWFLRERPRTERRVYVVSDTGRAVSFELGRPIEPL